MMIVDNRQDTTKSRSSTQPSSGPVLGWGVAVGCYMRSRAQQGNQQLSRQIVLFPCCQLIIKAVPPPQALRPCAGEYSYRVRCSLVWRLKQLSIVGPTWGA